MEIIERRFVAAAADRARDRVASAVRRCKKLAPWLLGSPIKNGMVQLYRNDSDFRTIVSIPHHLSFLAPDSNVGIEYRVTAYGKDGRKIGTAKRLIRHFATLQQPLDELIENLDDHGMFVVSCRYDTSAGIDFLGETSPQFMTIFVPRRDDSAPQLIHSHKYLDRLPPLSRAVSRTSTLQEGLETAERIDCFVLNTGPMSVRGAIELSNGTRRDFSMPGHGVALVTMDLDRRQPVDVTCRFDRVLNQRKPIVFRRFSSGWITASHS